MTSLTADKHQQDNRAPTSAEQDAAKNAACWDYADRFELRIAERPLTSVADFVERLTTRQPRWLVAVSMGITSTDELRRQTHEALTESDATNPAALAAGRIGIGRWRIVERGTEHVTFAEDMGIMRYRLTYRIEAPTLVSAETHVAQQTRWAGPMYWGLARIGHRRFLPLMLRNAGGPGATTVTIR